MSSACEKRRGRRLARWAGLPPIGIAALLAVPLWKVAPAPGQTVAHTLISDRVDGVHRDLGADVAPVEIGLITVRLSSPSHVLEVLEHELRLTPEEDGNDTAMLRARYRGEAELAAEVRLGVASSLLEDHLEIPLQDTEVAGRIQIEREGSGFRITTVELPSHVEIEVQSDLGAQLERLCQGLAVLALGGVDCAAVGQAFARLRLPLPEPGRSYLVDGADLTAVERRQLETYLAQR